MQSTNHLSTSNEGTAHVGSSLKLPFQGGFFNMMRRQLRLSRRCSPEDESYRYLP